MKLIVGLGNPDDKYAGTRHNIGWMVADALAQRHEATWQSKQKLEAEVAKGAEVVIAKPTTYMNASGSAVQAVTDYYKIPIDQVIVVTDDLNLPFGEIRFRENGGAGGHNGLKSVIAQLGTENFPRLRIGIGGPPGQDATPHVLGTFDAEEREQLPHLIGDAVGQIEEWFGG